MKTSGEKLFQYYFPYHSVTSRDIASAWGMAVWQGVTMDFLKFHPGPPWPILLSPVGGPSLKRPYDHFRGGPPAGVARPHGERPVADFYCFGHPTPCVYGLRLFSGRALRCLHFQTNWTSKYRFLLDRVLNHPVNSCVQGTKMKIP